MTQSTIGSGSAPGVQAGKLIEEGLAASQKGDSALAAQIFDQVVELAPAWYIPHFLLASEYAAAGDLHRAEAFFAQTVLLAPEFHIARYQLGLLQFSSGRPQIALVTLAPLESAPPDQPFSHLLKGFQALAAGRLKDATAHFKNGVLLVRANPALESDILKILDSIKQQLGSPLAADEHSLKALNTADPQQLENAKGVTSHVLLSNYAKKTVH